MTTKEQEQLQAVLDEFDRKEDECWEKIAFMDEHKFMYEKQAIDIRRQAYHECFRKLQTALSRMKMEGWAQEEEAQYQLGYEKGREETREKLIEIAGGIIHDAPEGLLSEEYMLGMKELLEKIKEADV